MGKSSKPHLVESAPTEGHEHISLAHGNGGRYMRELIESVFARHLSNPLLDIQADAVPLPLAGGEVMFTTDGFTVQPLEFPGGDIGSLAVHGTVNDLSVAGAKPLYLSLNAFIEEGLEVALLDRVIASLARAAKEAGVQIACGDTKVVRRGEGGGLYLATTGVGVKDRNLKLGMDKIKPGDAILVSGPVGDHGIAVMFAREQFGLRGDLQSDSANVWPLTSALLGLPGLRFMRDPTRGGLAMIANEIARATGLGVRLMQPAIPIRPPVASVCEMLGYDPLYLACEGRVVAVVAKENANAVLKEWKKLPQGKDAAIIGVVENSNPQTGHPGPAALGSVLSPKPHVVLQTELGGERVLEELEDDPLPRIC